MRNKTREWKERVNNSNTTWKSSSSLINSMASSISNLPWKIPIEITRECDAAASASIAANSQSSVFLRRFSIAFTRPSSCLPPKKLEYTTGLKPNSDSTHFSKGANFSTCLSENFKRSSTTMLVQYFCEINFSIKMGGKSCSLFKDKLLCQWNTKEVQQKILSNLRSFFPLYSLWISTIGSAKLMRT